MNALAKVVETTREFDDYPPLEDVSKKVAALEQQRAALLPIEDDAKKLVSVQLEKAHSIHNRIVHFQKYGGKYKPISMDCLKIRDFSGLPVLIPFAISDPSFFIKVVSERGEPRHDAPYYAPTISGTIQNYYQDVSALLFKRANRLSRDRFFSRHKRIICSINVRFSGVIPENTRKKIEEAKREFGNNIYILAEVKCKIEDTTEFLPQPVPVDPLVLGFDGTSLWLIDQFDITPLEKAFTS